LALRIALSQRQVFFLEFGFAIGVGIQDYFGEFSHIELLGLEKSRRLDELGRP
jgi:hypothetical protein